MHHSSVCSNLLVSFYWNREKMEIHLGASRKRWKSRHLLCFCLVLDVYQQRGIDLKWKRKALLHQLQLTALVMKWIFHAKMLWFSRSGSFSGTNWSCFSLSEWKYWVFINRGGNQPVKRFSCCKVVFLKTPSCVNQTFHDANYHAACIETHAGAGLHMQEMCKQRGSCKIQQKEILPEVISISGTDINSEVGDHHINSRIRWDDSCRTLNSGECNQVDVKNLHLDQSRNCMNITSDWEELCHQNLSATQKMEWWERRRPLGRKCAAYYISLLEKIVVVVKLQTSVGGWTDPLLDQQETRHHRCFLSSPW